MDAETGVCVVTHELFSSPVQLIGIVMPLAPKKLEWTTDEFKAAVARYEAKLGYKLKKASGSPKILSLSEVEKLCPVPHILNLSFLFIDSDSRTRGLIAEPFANFLKDYLAFFGSNMSTEDLCQQMVYEESRRLHNAPLFRNILEFHRRP